MNHFSCAPKDVVQQLFFFVDFGDLISLSETCKWFHDIIKDNQPLWYFCSARLWKNLELDSTLLEKREWNWRWLGFCLTMRAPFAYKCVGSSYYLGRFIDEKLDGFGCYISGNGIYLGQWKDGKKEGQGTYYYKKGDRYEGQWKGGKIEGQGTYYYTDGDRYEGQFKGGETEGQGTYYYNNGDHYEGQWKGGKEEGQGIYYCKNGDRYEGQWKG